MKKHSQYMRRCIQLAQNGLGSTYPNPLVGCVIVYEDRIIGEGWHYQAGQAHAEVNAINSVKKPELLTKATLYVSLEPCSHFGKTPPCSDLIIAKGIKKIVIGTIDSFAEVSGRGIQKLIQAGCDVTVGILENECNDLNRRFFTFHNKKRPYIILKWAETQEHFIAPTNLRTERAPVWITQAPAKQLVHQWRAEEQAILVGTRTAALDNPRLTLREWQGNQPVRILLDKNNKVPKNSLIFDTTARTICFVETPIETTPDSTTEYIKVDFDKNLIQSICQALYERSIQSLIVEGGATTLQSFIDLDLWDEARVFTGKTFFKEGTLGPSIKGYKPISTYIGADLLTVYHND
ncbi:bifunctional diaminohydroxyphosphoribosylaminopyrimidine deaminase/5-amino-6-(5-phosphoribosylamino)uracil reductase RibD [Aquimarina sp. W85]|uniref:bifunctional diaminohydroxyphosphoribosylaminopyrimidine deaminase/5-amino-6-(5-phosphoribosylamino)uracil reductase RibD n=1 Tax=Aquimarina rhodophyticola TaxID=3342246 RepID=UPI00367050A3